MEQLKLPYLIKFNQTIKKMKLQNQLSIKSVLRLALPCLASVLLFTACSNDGSEPTPGGSDNVTSGTVRFTASAPLKSGAVTTRIGIDDAAKPTVDQFDTEEPVIWIADDRVSVFFVPQEEGEVIHAQFRVDGSTLSEDRKSAELVNVASLNIPNGTYTIYAFTPYDADNGFNCVSLDLSNQTQQGNHSNYKHLGSTASMRADGVGATFTAGSTSDPVNFQFAHITSFLRFNITNSLDAAINVTDISLTHPYLRTNTTYDVENDVFSGDVYSPLSLFLDGGKYLSENEAFDAYFSTLPIYSNTSEADQLDLTIYYTCGDIESNLHFQIPASELISDFNDHLFPVGTRFLFEISISDASGGSDFSVHKYGNIYVTKNDYPYNIQYGTYQDKRLSLVGELADISCPHGYSLLTGDFVDSHFKTSEDRISFFEDIDLLPGKLDPSSYTLSYAYIFPRSGDLVTLPNQLLQTSSWSHSGQGNSVVGIDKTHYLDVRCVKVQTSSDSNTGF
jgi:hypothetical protein